jgi:hypothetical protein
MFVRRLVGTRWACLALVSSALAGGCGSGAAAPSIDHATLGGVAWSAPRTGTQSSCSIVSGDTEVMVAAAMHDVSSACVALRRGLSSTSRRWRQASLQTSDAKGLPIQFTVTCTLTAPDGDERVTVVAPSSATLDLARSACARFGTPRAWQRTQSETTTTLAPVGY